MHVLFLEASHSQNFDLKEVKRSEYFQQVIEQWELIKSETRFFGFTSSGSTGIPKSISLSREQLSASARRTAEFFQLNERSLLVCCLNVKYIAGFMMLFRAYQIGAKVLVVEPSSDLSCLLEYQEHQNISTDFISLVPTQVDWLLTQPIETASRLANTILVGGAGLTIQQELMLSRFQPNSWLGYGMTETCSHIALRQLSKSTDFLLLPDISVRVDYRGCLAICADVTRYEWVQTNDVVALDGDRVTYFGRIDRVINTGGLKINAEWLEQSLADLMSNAGASTFHITSVPSEKWGEEVVLLYTGDVTIDLDHAISMYGALETWQKPKHICRVELIPLTQTGKVDLAAVKAMAISLIS